MEPVRWQRREGVGALRPTLSVIGCAGILVQAILFVVPAQADGRAFGVDTELSYTSDSNVSRAQADSDIRADRILGIGVGVGFKQSLGTNTRMLYRGFVRGEGFAENTRLNNANAGAAVTFQYRFSGRLLAPTFGVFGKVSVADYQSAIRSSSFYTAGLSFNKNLTDRFAATLVLSGTARDSDSLVFDTREGSLLFNLDYQTRSGSAIYLTYNFLGGDTVSTGAPTLAIVDAAKAIVADDTFGGAAANQFAYRLLAHTQVVTLGFNFPIAAHHALDVSARYAHAQATANAGITYDRTLFSLAYLAQF